LEKSFFSSDYMRKWFDFPPLVAVVAWGRNSEHTVFRRGAAPEKKRAVRTEGSNSGKLKGMGMALFMGKKGGKMEKMTVFWGKKWKKAEKLKKKLKN